MGFFGDEEKAKQAGAHAGFAEFVVDHCGEIGRTALTLVTVYRDPGQLLKSC